MTKIDLLLKIGGSVLTDKLQADVINHDIIENICKVLKELYDQNIRMCIITGVGSVGHQAVAKYSVQRGDNGTIERRLGLLETQIKVNKLRNVFLQAMLYAGVPVVQIYTSSIATSDKMAVSSFNLKSCEGFLDTKMVPIISGDVIPDSTIGYSVLSGDIAFLEISKQWSPTTLVYGTNVNGIFTEDPNINKEAKLIPLINSKMMDDVIKGISIGISEDVSGAMLGKFKAITSILKNNPTNKIHILNLTEPSNLQKLMDNEDFNHTVIED